MAYASEAGMPLIADPGFELGRAAAEAGHAVTSAPGPTAVTTALALSGLATDAFFFGGFLPSAAAARRARLSALAAVPGTLAFYESPKRLAAALADMAEVLGGAREAAVCRELTKKFEEIRRAPLAELAAAIAEAPPRGEIVVIVERGRSENISEADLEQDLKAALQTHSVRDAADLVAGLHNAKRRDVYQLALKLAKG